MILQQIKSIYTSKTVAIFSSHFSPNHARKCIFKWLCAQSLDPLIWREMQISPALTSLPSLSIYNFTFDLILEIDT